MKSHRGLAVLVSLGLGFGAGVRGMELDCNSQVSIKNAASKVAGGLVGHWFKGEQAAVTAGFEVPAMWFWWEAGEIWNGLINYWSYTGDTTYLKITQSYLAAQIGPHQNYMLDTHSSDEANDDQSHFGIAAMNAAEKGLPKPLNGPTWLQSVISLWNSQAVQWDTTACNGGLRWGISPGDGKYLYKNTITNGAFFQLSARLALATGEQKYAEWAEKVFNWSRSAGLVTGAYEVLDGIHTTTCQDFSTQRWSINHGIYLYGAAVMYKKTGSSIWKSHTDGLLNAASSHYFTSPNGKSIMWEPNCESSGSCNNDMKIFKAALARYLYETAVVAPHTETTVFKLLEPSAKSAAAACTGDGGSLCGSKWYAADDGQYGPTSQLSALEVIQGMLLRPGVSTGNPARGNYIVSSEPEPKETASLEESFDTIGIVESKAPATSVESSTAPTESSSVPVESSTVYDVPKIASSGDIYCPDSTTSPSAKMIATMVAPSTEATTPAPVTETPKSFEQAPAPAKETSESLNQVPAPAPIEEPSAPTIQNQEPISQSSSSSYITEPLTLTAQTQTSSQSPSLSCTSRPTYSSLPSPSSSSFSTTTTKTSSTPHEPTPTSGAKSQNEFSSDGRAGPSFALLIFCVMIGMGVIGFA